MRLYRADHIQQRHQFVMPTLFGTLQQVLLHSGDLCDHCITCIAQTGQFVMDLLIANKIVRNVHATGRHQHGPPDGDAA